MRDGSSSLTSSASISCLTDMKTTCTQVDPHSTNEKGQIRVHEHYRPRLNAHEVVCQLQQARLISSRHERRLACMTGTRFTGAEMVQMLRRRQNTDTDTCAAGSSAGLTRHGACQHLQPAARHDESELGRRASPHCVRRVIPARSETASISKNASASGGANKCYVLGAHQLTQK